MNIFSAHHVHSFSSYATSLFEERMFTSLTSQQKKILCIVSLALGCLALCYAINRSGFWQNQTPSLVAGSVPTGTVEEIEKEDFTIEFEDNVATIEDKNIQKIAENNLLLIKKDLLQALEITKKDHLGNSYDYECRNQNIPSMNTLKTRLVLLYCDSEGVIHSMEAYNSSCRYFPGSLTYGSHVTMKMVEAFRGYKNIPVLISGAPLHVCTVDIQFTCDQNNNNFPFILEKCPESEPIKKMMELMIDQLNKKASKLAVVKNFDELPRVQQPMM